jgi:PAS domain S-box-containing protein
MMKTEDGLLITAIVLLALLALSIFLSWYRFRAMSKKTEEKRLSGQPSTASYPETKTNDSSIEALREALSGIQDGILILDMNQGVEFVNSAAERIFGARHETINGPTFIEIVRDYEFDALLKKKPPQKAALQCYCYAGSRRIQVRRDRDRYDRKTASGRYTPGPHLQHFT